MTQAPAFDLETVARLIRETHQGTSSRSTIYVAADIMALHDAELSRLLADLADAVRVLEPFAEAARRINYYDGDGYNAPLYAYKENCLVELLDGIEGQPLTVTHLRAALSRLKDAKP